MNFVDNFSQKFRNNVNRYSKLLKPNDKFKKNMNKMFPWKDSSVLDKKTCTRKNWLKRAYTTAIILSLLFLFIASLVSGLIDNTDPSGQELLTKIYIGLLVLFFFVALFYHIGFYVRGYLPFQSNSMMLTITVLFIIVVAIIGITDSVKQNENSTLFQYYPVILFAIVFVYYILQFISVYTITKPQIF